MSDVIAGLLTDRMQIADGGQLDLAEYIHPRAEPEVAILGHPLRSVAAAARLARRHGCPPRPGWIVLAGAATADGSNDGTAKGNGRAG